MTQMHDGSNGLILLFGMPRSGTTWIGKTFDSHPAISYRHEPDSQFRLNDTLPLMPDLADAETYRDSLKQYINLKLPRCSPRCCGKHPFFPKTGESSLGFRLHPLLITSAKVVEKLLGRAISWPARPGGRIAWKSIESLGRLGTLLTLFPDSRGIMIVRDPRGYVASVLRGQAQGKFLTSSSIADDWGLFELLCDTPYARRIGINLDTIRAEEPIRRLAWLWLLFNQKTMDEILEMDNGLMVRYEDICADPLDVFHTLFDFCGLDWNEQTHAFLSSSIRNTKDDYYSVYKDPLESANKWQHELTREQSQAITALVEEHPVGRWFLAGRQTQD